MFIYIIPPPLRLAIPPGVIYVPQQPESKGQDKDVGEGHIAPLLSSWPGGVFDRFIIRFSSM